MVIVYGSWLCVVHHYAYAAILLKRKHCTLLTFLNFMIYRLARSIFCLWKRIYHLSVTFSHINFTFVCRRNSRNVSRKQQTATIFQNIGPEVEWRYNRNLNEIGQGMLNIPYTYEPAWCLSRKMFNSETQINEWTLRFIKETIEQFILRLCL